MAYRNSYRGGYRGRSGSTSGTVGLVSKANARAGQCRTCGFDVAAGAGQLYREASGAWSVVHREAFWQGSPVSGQYVGGCARMCGECGQTSMSVIAATGRRSCADREACAERRAEVLACPHCRYADDADRNIMPCDEHSTARAGVIGQPAASKYAYTASGARMTASSRRCEDAPCCGCCD